ncbi:hypothetical protein AX16_001184 [Volvariella volvacea WC 439]|nr:hypothetical protein AX16_001184 [Volvariella volvacea WC 439]
MPLFSNITNLPTYPLNRNSNPLLQNEPPWNRSSAKLQNIAPGSSPIDYTLQYPTRSTTPHPPIRGCSVAPPPSPTLSIRGFPPVGPYHVDNDKEDPNDIRYSPGVPTTNQTHHGDITEDVITQSDLDIRDFEYAWRVPPHIVLRTTRRRYFELREISGTLEDPIPILHDTEAHIVFRTTIKMEEIGTLDSPAPVRQPSPVVNATQEEPLRVPNPLSTTTTRRQSRRRRTHPFGTITAPATPAIPIPSAPPPAYFTSTPNNATQPIAPEYTEYTSPILHHLENLTMSYGRNPETRLPIGEYI